MAGRKISEITYKIKDILQLNINSYVLNGRVEKPSAIIWSQLIKDNKLEIRAKNLYTRALNYWKNENEQSCVTGEMKAITKSNKLYDSAAETSFNSSMSVSDYISDSNSDSKDVMDYQQQHFTIHIQSDEWNDIYPEEVSYFVKKKPLSSQKINRKYYKLKKNCWTSIFSKAIWNTTKLKCVWKFPSHYVCTNKSLIFLKIKGLCQQCSSKIYCELKNDPALTKNENGVFVSCTVVGNPSKVVHTKKRV